MNIYFCKYNNYFNRKLKKSNIVNDYLGSDYQNINNVSFNSNDGVNTKQITLTDYKDKYDYAIVTKSSVANKQFACWKEDFKSHKVDIIKLARIITGLGLSDAKNLINKIFDNLKVGDSIREDITKAGATILDTYSTEESIVEADTSGYVAILLEKTVGGEVIESRWFILESKRLRTGQYELVLKRDVLADYYDQTFRAPIFIQKAMLNNKDPMICNDEGMTLNKIKVAERLLKGRSNSSWIVGYTTKKDFRKGNDETGEIITEVKVTDDKEEVSALTPGQIAEEVGTTEAIINSILSGQEVYSTIDQGEINYGLTFTGIATLGPLKEKIYLDNNNIVKGYDHERVVIWGDPLIKSHREVGESYVDLAMWKNVDCNSMLNAATGHVTLNAIQVTKLRGIFENNSILYNGEIYKIQYILQTSERKQYTLPSTNDELSTILHKYSEYDSSAEYPVGMSYWWVTEQHGVLKFAKTISKGTYSIPLSSATERSDCSGSVCDIFAIPFESIKFSYYDHGTVIVDSISDKDLLLKIASEIATTLDKQLYDMQLLPYCPFDGQVGDYVNGVLDFQDSPTLIENKDYGFITKGENKERVSIIYWFSSNQLSFNIQTNLTVINKKIESNTDMLRICSPSGQGMFDMNVAKNDGLDFIRVNCTFKPYNPYIQILPNFKNLYGADYNDYRGLLATGDFSLSRITDAWVQYQLNNKNYQNIFNREIANLDFQQNQERAMQPFEVMANTVASGAAGAVSGLYVGGVYGAIAGAAVGTVVGGVSGALDIAYSEKARKEARDYAIDRFNYNLGNVKAMPNTITKVDSFVVNAKIYPFFEFYSCTQIEKEAFENKIKYDGMAVNRIGTISEFIGNGGFFKGQLIRLEDIENDAHIVNTIYDELIKGVYL